MHPRAVGAGLAAVGLAVWGLAAVAGAAAVVGSPGAVTATTGPVTAATLPVPAPPRARPLLDDDQAARHSVAEVLRRTGVAGALREDPWDPDADLPIAAPEPPTPDLLIDPAVADGVHRLASVQAAVDAAHRAGPADGGRPWVIELTPGVYSEVVYVPAGPERILLLGRGADPSATVIRFDLAASTPGDDGTPASYAARVGPAFATADADSAAMYAGCAARATLGTACSSVLWVRENGFQARNLTVENAHRAAPGTAGGQAVAAQVDNADRVHLSGVHLLGHQDTAFFRAARADATVRVAVDDCLLTGDVDAVFGWATVYFRHCEFRWNGAERGLTGGYLAAPATNYRIPYGFVMADSRFTLDPTAPAAGRPAAGPVHLARQWFAGAPCSPYGTNGSACPIDPDGTAAGRGAPLSTVETVGRMVLLRCAVDPALATAPWADWNPDPTAAAYRPVTYDSDEYWAMLRATGLDPLRLYPQGPPTPAEPFLGEYEPQ